MNLARAILRENFGAGGDISPFHYHHHKCLKAKAQVSSSDPDFLSGSRNTNSKLLSSMECNLHNSQNLNKHNGNHVDNDCGTSVNIMSQLVRGHSFENCFTGKMDSPLTRKPNFKPFNQAGGTSLFSTAVITGYSVSDINVKSQFDVQRLPIVSFDSTGRFPSIRSLETLHNALSLKELDNFLERILSVNYRPTMSLTPASSTNICPENPSDLDVVRNVSNGISNLSILTGSSADWNGSSGYISSGPNSPLLHMLPEFPIVLKYSTESQNSDSVSPQSSLHGGGSEPGIFVTEEQSSNDSDKTIIATADAQSLNSD
jgi:hypothetical protein